MLFVRSTLFNIAFYLNTIAFLIVFMPFLLIPRKGTLFIQGLWGRTNAWLLEKIAGTRIEYRNAPEKLDGSMIVMSKHQSALETFALLKFFTDSAFILKKEIEWIPFFGWWSMKFRMIPVRRGTRKVALASMTEGSKQAIDEGRQIVVFPEGTRRPAGAEPRYKYGSMHLYETLGVDCHPVALNSGVFWPRRKWLRYPGTVIIEFLDPIPPGMDKDEFHKALERTLEPACDRLLLEAANAPNPPPLGEHARARIAELGQALAAE